MQVLFEGSFEQKTFQAMSCLLDYSESKPGMGFSLVSSFDDHMFVMTENGDLLKLQYDGRKVLSEELVSSVQSLRNPVITMISEEVKRIVLSLDEYVKESSLIKEDIGLTRTIFQKENLVKLLTKYVILEQKAEEKAHSKRDITFFKRAIDFLDDLGAYLKRLIKESKDVPIAFTLVEDLALGLEKIDTILSREA